MESKIDKCLKAVSKATQAQPSNKTGNQRAVNPKRESNSAPVTPSKSKGPSVSAAGPFRGKNGKPIRCWRCGGWGHTSRRMSYPGKLELEGIIRGSKPSKRRSEGCPEQIKGDQRKRGEGESKKLKVTRMEEKKFKKIVTKQAKSRYYNPDPLLRLIGEANETKIKLDGAEVKALVDSGSQISTVTERFAKLMGWKIKKSSQPIRHRGNRGSEN